MLCVTLIFQSIPANASVKAGAKCTSLGVASVVGNKVHTCIKSGKRLVWSKGIVTRTPKVPNTSTKEPSFEITPANLFNNKSVCQLKQNYQGYGQTGFGFPRSIHRLTNSGEVKGILVFVEFNDVKGTDDPLVEGKKLSENFIKFYQAMSYGKLQFKVDIHSKYIPINADSGKYGMQTHDQGDAGLYLRDALNASDPYVDYSSYEFVAIIPPSGIKNIVFGPAFPLPPSDSFAKTNEKILFNATVGGSDWRNEKANWIWLSHEVGHLLGMEHQYKVNRAEELGLWDLMNNMWSSSPALFAWHRFLQDWFSDNQILCSDLNFYSQSKAVVDISTLSIVDDNLKTVMIKINESEIIVIEVRKKAPFDLVDARPTFEGLLVYKVDVNRKSNEGAITLITTPYPTREVNSNLVGTFGVSEYVETDGLRITNLGNSKNGYYVEIKKS